MLRWKIIVVGNAQVRLWLLDCFKMIIVAISPKYLMSYIALKTPSRQLDMTSLRKFQNMSFSNYGPKLHRLTKRKQSTRIRFANSGKL